MVEDKNKTLLSDEALGRLVARLRKRVTPNSPEYVKAIVMQADIIEGLQARVDRLESGWDEILRKPRAIYHIPTNSVDECDDWDNVFDEPGCRPEQD